MDKVLTDFRLLPSLRPVCDQFERSLRRQWSAYAVRGENLRAPYAQKKQSDTHGEAHPLFELPAGAMVGLWLQSHNGFHERSFQTETQCQTRE
jgi:hypothetical protein